MGGIKLKGIALVMVLTTMGLLLLLLGTFVQLNRDHFSLVNDDQHHDLALDAAHSAFEYCSYRIEHDKLWCAGPFPDDRVDGDVAETLSVRELKGTRKLSGKVVRSEATFEVEALNNIDGTVTLDGVPKGACRFRMSAYSGAAVVRREALMTTVPLYDASALSSKGIDIQANRLVVDSVDPVRNRLRSKGDISVPDFRHDFVFPARPKASERGVLWALGGIEMGKGNNLADPKTLAEAAKVTKGAFYTMAQTNYEIHDLKISEIEVSKKSVTLPGGIYVFSRGSVDYTNKDGEKQRNYIPMLQRRAWAIKDGQLDGGVVLEYWYLVNKLPPGHSVTELVDSKAIGHQVDHMEFSLENGVTADLDINRLTIDSDLNLKVAGDFGVASDQYDIVPHVVFRDPDNGRISNGSVSAAGNLIIEGVVIGSGKLLAAGDVSLRPNYAHLDADISSDLSIYAGGSILVSPPANVGAKFGTQFKGLLYAKKDIIYDAGERSINVRGAMVARDGVLKISRATTVTLTYDPAYLDSILKKLPMARARLERSMWKEI